MEPATLAAVLGVIGTFLGSLLGAITSGALVKYRIEQLEKKVEAHNALVERTYKIERDLTTCFNRYDALSSRVERVERE